MPRRNGEDQDWRRRVKDVHWHLHQPHDPDAPDYRQQRRHQRQDQPLPSPERFVVQQADDQYRDREQPVDPVGEDFSLMQEHRVATQGYLDARRILLAQDLAHIGQHRAEAVRVLLELQHDRSGAPVTGDHRVPVHRVGVDRRLQFLDLRRAGRQLVTQQRFGLETVSVAADALGLPR
ncbi:hypothetical protein D3C76_590080 [compost metagenome]